MKLSSLLIYHIQLSSDITAALTDKSLTLSSTEQVFLPAFQKNSPIFQGG